MHLKSIVRILTGFFTGAAIAVSAYAQCPPQQGGSNELGIRLGGLTNSSNISGRYMGGATLFPSFLNGIHYKRYGEVAAFRASFAYQHLDEDRFGTTEYTDGRVNGYFFKAGYERFAVFGMVEPYAAIDLQIAYGEYEGDHIISPAGSPGVDYTERRTRMGYGVSPAVGLRIFAGYSISFNVETSLDVMAYNSTQEHIPGALYSAPGTDGYNTGRTRTSSFGVKWQPLSWMSVSVLF